MVTWTLLNVTSKRTLPVLFTVQLAKDSWACRRSRYKDNLLFCTNETAVGFFLYSGCVWILNSIFISILIFSHLARDLPSCPFLSGRLSFYSVACVLHDPSSFHSCFYYINNLCRKIHCMKLVVLWCYILEQFVKGHFFLQVCAVANNWHVSGYFPCLFLNSCQQVFYFCSKCISWVTPIAWNFAQLFSFQNNLFTEFFMFTQIWESFRFCSRMLHWPQQFFRPVGLLETEMFCLRAGSVRCAKKNDWMFLLRGKFVQQRANGI